MKIQQTIQKCLDDWNRISGLDFCILDENDQIYISTGDHRLPSSEKLAQFREDPALCISNRSCSLYKLNNIPPVSYTHLDVYKRQKEYSQSDM